MTHADAQQYAELVAVECAGTQGLCPEVKELKRSVARLLEVVPDEPRGAPLAERWHANGMDRYVIAMCSTPAGVPRKKRQEARFAYRALVRAQIVRPTMELALIVRSSGLVIHASEIDTDPELAAISERAVAAGLITAAKSITRVVRALAAVKAYFGKNLADITPSEWHAFSQARRSLIGRTIEVEVAPNRLGPISPITAYEVHDLGTPYAWAVAAGYIDDASGDEVIGRVVPGAMRSLHRPRPTLAILIERYGASIPVKVRRVVELTLNISGVGLDRSTLRDLIWKMNAFYVAVREVVPGCTTLAIPVNKVHDIVERLSTCETGPGERVERRGLGSLLGSVQGLYDLIAEARAEEPDAFAGLLSAKPGVRFPVSHHAIAARRSREKVLRRNSLTKVVDPIVGMLGELTESAWKMAHSGCDLVESAKATKRGRRFTTGPLTWERSRFDVFGSGDVDPMPMVRRAGSRGQFRRADDVGLALTRNAVVWLLARYTGMRTEELGEATLDNIETTPLPSGDFAPILYIPRSKSDRSHRVVLQRKAMEAIELLVVMMKRRYGTFPLAPRFDPYEEVEQPPRRLLFISVAGPDLRGPYLATINQWMTEVCDWIERDLGRELPARVGAQMLRRIRASELNRLDVNVFAVMQNLGHAHAFTTEIYTYPDEGQIVDEFLRAVEGADTNGPSDDADHGGDDELRGGSTSRTGLNPGSGRASGDREVSQRRAV